MDNDSPTLEVGFAIDFFDSFGQLKSLDDLIGSAAAKAVREFQKVEAATKGAVNLSSATAQFTSFGNAATRELQAVARETARVDNAGEALSRQMERQIATFGMSRAAAQALRSEQAGLTEQAERLRAQEATLAQLRTQAAAAQRAEAAATAALAREHAALAAAVQGSHAAQVADAAAAERLRISTDPLYAAMKRLNAELAESTRLYHAGATAPAEYARQQEVLTQRLKATAAQHDAVAVAGQRNAQSLRMVAIQLPDIVQGLLTGQKPLQVFLQQGGQIAQIGMMAEGGLKGMAAQIGRAALGFWPLAVAAGAGVLAIKGFQSAANDGADMKKYAASLGLTQKEIRHLTDLHVTFGDTAKAVFQVAGRAIWDGIGPGVTTAWNTMQEWLSWLGGAVKSTVNFLIGGFVGAYQAVSKTWQQFPAVMGDVFLSAVNSSVEAINRLIRKAVEGVNGFISSANTILDKVGLHLPGLDAPEIAKVNNQFAGAAKTFSKTMTDELKKAQSVDYLGQVGTAITEQARKNARDRIKAQAESKGYLDPDKAKTDRHAEQLAREAEATEAQIRNLYALADAYKVSGAAALIAEARVKAESQAIKQRADIEAAVERQIRLAIAQRVSDAAKGTLASREQAAAQERINAMVSAGLVPAERASDLVRDQIAELPLLAALQVSQQRGYAKEIDAAKRALDDQRAARERLTEAERTASFNSAMAAGASRIAELKEELRLIGATDAARVRALATIKASQEAEKFNPADRAAYIAQQVQIADLDLQRQLRADAFNDSLRYQADLLDAIANNVSIAANGMADAFGKAGQALGGLASTFASYLADQQRMKTAREAELRVISQIDDAQLRAQREQQVNALYAQRNLTSQVGLYGDLASSAKGFFKEGSSGYKSLEAAEKAFRAVEFALSVRAMAQDAAATASFIAKSGARTAQKAVEAVVTAISSLPFPLNLAAGAATIAAIASLGVSIAGSFGGNKNTLPKANDGTGTVLGDSSAKSDSIKRAIDSLKEVDTLTSSYAREMAASLKSIESQIGGFASLLVRAGNIDASEGVNTGFKTDTTGKLLSGIITGGGILSKIPIVGGIIGAVGNIVGSLFGTKTSIIGNGLYGGAQSLGDILSGGFDASYYSDIKKKKKFFGITSSTKYSTRYADADPLLENQFTLILRQFNDAILAAAGPLGEATGTIQQRLNSFVLNIGKIDLKGLTGAEIEEKLNAVFGAAADDLAKAAFPGIDRFQQVGEGLFETLVRVASTVESVTNSLGLLGSSAVSMSTDLKMALADQFDSVSDFTNAVDGYFQTYYTKEEQAAAKTAQFGKVFDSLGLSMPASLAGFRALVEAQDLTTKSGQATYATLLQLAPAFADLQSALNGAKSAADIASERADLQRQLLELQGNTAAIRALDLANLDESNRAIQEQIWAMQDAKAAADAADQLRQAWASVGDGIMDEVKRIRGLTGGSQDGNYASLLGQFNAATAAARAGDQDMAKALPGLSQALLKAAADAATSRQELDRIQAQTAASLEATFGAINALTGANPSASATLTAAATAAQASNPAPSVANDNLAAEVKALRQEVSKLREENNAGHAANAGNTGAIKRKLDDVTAASGGEAISVVGAAA